MTTGKCIAPHEALELHELLTFKNVCATKSATMAGLVKDEQLKQLLQDDANLTQCHIIELQSLMQTANWNQTTSSSTTTTTTSTGMKTY